MNELTLHASAYNEHCSAILHSSKTVIGHVHSVFHHVINIEIKGLPIISIQHDSLVLKPMAICIRYDKSFLGLPIYEHDEVNIYEDMIRIKDNLVIACKQAVLFSSKFTVSHQKRSLTAVIEQLHDFRQQMLLGDSLGILPLYDVLYQQENACFKQNQYTKFLSDRMKRFLSCIKNKDISSLSEVSSNIVGCGIGLTPSSDDFLIGFIAAMYYTNHYFSRDIFMVNEIIEQIKCGIRGRTTRLSLEFIEFACDGEFDSDIIKCIEAIFYEVDVDITTTVVDIQNHGSTSGSDTTFGIYTGLTFWLEEFGGIYE